MSLFFEITLLGLILSADSFSAAVAMGSRRFSRLELAKFATTSSLAECGATVAGYFAGATVISAISEYDHWIAFLLLAGVAAHLFFEGISELKASSKVSESRETDETPHSFLKIVVVSVATSLDSFGVGISLGIAHRPIVPFSLSIGLWACVSTIAGVYLGNRASKKFGPIFTIIAGIVLAALSFKMLSI